MSIFSAQRMKGLMPHARRCSDGDVQARQQQALRPVPNAAAILGETMFQRRTRYHERAVCPPTPFKVQSARVPRPTPVFVPTTPESRILEDFRLTGDTGYFGKCLSNDKLLGQGSFGVVFKSTCSTNQQLYAIKQCHEKKRARREAEILRQLRHPNIVAFYCAWEEGEYLFIQMELCERGSLSKYLSQNELLEETQIWRFLLDIALGVQHIHKAGFVHLDLKPDNFFLKDSGIVIGDFGSARPANDVESHFEGDARYTSPEGKATFEADMFSIGASLLDMTADIDMPSQRDLWARLRRGSVREIITSMLPNQRSMELIQLTEDLMSPIPSLRPTIIDVLERDPLLRLRNLAASTQGATGVTPSPAPPQHKRPRKDSSSPSMAHMVPSPSLMTMMPPPPPRLAVTPDIEDDVDMALTAPTAPSAPSAPMAIEHHPSREYQCSPRLSNITARNLLKDFDRLRQ